VCGPFGQLLTALMRPMCGRQGAVEDVELPVQLHALA
jgi:hypothetical protein